MLNKLLNFKKNNHPTIPTYTPHVQKKYFSLMLVPSYTSGKTRSFRISIKTIYSVFVAMVAVVIISSLFYVQSNFFRAVAEDVTVYLEQAQEAYDSLQEVVNHERNQLMASVNSILADLNDERFRTEEEMLQLHQTYIENLDFFWTYAKSLETELRRYEIYIDEIFERLGESSHIASVRNVLNDRDMLQSQIYLVSALEELEEFYTTTIQGQSMTLLAHTPAITQAQETINDLFGYIDMLERAMTAQEEFLGKLNHNVSTVGVQIRRDRYGPQLLYWSYVRDILPRNTPVKITDVRTRNTFWVNSFSHGSHADVFPVSVDDTAILHSLYNGRWSWDTRPIWVHVGDRRIAASINGMPHGGGGNRGNNMNGHLCIHFRGSRTHNGSTFHERDHQGSVMEAYRATP